MSQFSFHLSKIETRTKEVNGVPNYIIKGYATLPNHVYPYKTTPDRTFREYFSTKALENLKRKIKSEKVFVDAEHINATRHSSEKILDNIKNKTGINVDEEVNYIKNRLKYSELPMFKVEDIKVDDNGLFLEVKGNPFYRDQDEDHRNYFDAVWGSLEQGFINGMSLNFKPTETVQINDGLTQIDDIELYGISLTGSPSNEMATITEVAMRSIEHIRGESKCQKKKQKQTTSLLML